MASRSSRPTSASGVSSRIQRGSPLESADITNHQANDHGFDVGDNIAGGCRLSYYLWSLDISQPNIKLTQSKVSLILRSSL